MILNRLMEFLNNVLKKKLMSKTLGGLMEILYPNHVDLDLYYPIGWSNSQTHILYISYINIYKMSCYLNSSWAITN